MSNTLSLETLPPELLLHICSFLDARFVLEVVSKVSQHLYCLINDESNWKARFLEKWSRKHFFVEDEKFDWKEACIDREEQYALWRNHKTNMKCHILPEIHFGFVDTVHLIEEGAFGISAARDRSFGIWNMEKLGNGEEGDNLLHHHVQEAHEGWIWCLDSMDQHLYTGAWDNTVKGWDLNSFQSWESVKGTSAILCMTHVEKCLCIGAYRQILVSDIRLPHDSVQTFVYHKRPVLCLAADNKYMISGSEDKSVVIYDRVAGKIFKRLELEKYVRCLSYDGKNLWMGDQGGNVHLVKPSESAAPKTFESIHKNMITGIHHSIGSIITCSSDHTLKVFEPTLDLELIGVAPSEFPNSGVATYQNIVMVANASFSAQVWLPVQADQYMPRRSGNSQGLNAYLKPETLHET